MTFDIVAHRMALAAISQERYRQHSDLWGEQDLQPLEWLAILTEEVGEVSREALRLQTPALHDPSGEYDLLIANLRAAYRKELMQVAAVACAAIECLDRNGGEDACPTCVPA